MIAEIIITGTELLSGEIADENSRWLAEFLNLHGFTVEYITTVGNNPVQMKNVISTALSRVDIVITLGGLGAAQRDITKRVGAEAIGVPYVYYEDQGKRLKNYYKQKGRSYSKVLMRQAWFGANSYILENYVGPANGSAICRRKKILIHLPRKPFEVKIMAEREMMPWLENQLGIQGIVYSIVVPITGMTETEIESCIADLIQREQSYRFALLARSDYIELRITVHGQTAQEAYQLIVLILAIIKERIPISGCPIKDNVRNNLAEALIQYKMTMSAAESCTGGIIGEIITDLPGSSVYFKGSAVTYWNDAKVGILGVSEEILKKYTAVSAAVACQMAEGSRIIYGSDLAVSTTGYAGPGLGERNEPPGLVYIAVAGKNGTEVYEEHFIGDRKNIRYEAAEKALYYVLQYIKLDKGG